MPPLAFLNNSSQVDNNLKAQIKKKKKSSRKTSNCHRGLACVSSQHLSAGAQDGSDHKRVSLLEANKLRHCAVWQRRMWSSCHFLNPVRWRKSVNILFSSVLTFLLLLFSFLFTAACHIDDKESGIGHRRELFRRAKVQSQFPSFVELGNISSCKS